MAEYQLSVGETLESVFAEIKNKNDADAVISFQRGEYYPNFAEIQDFGNIELKTHGPENEVAVIGQSVFKNGMAIKAIDPALHINGGITIKDGLLRPGRGISIRRTPDVLLTDFSVYDCAGHAVDLEECSGLIDRLYVHHVLAGSNSDPVDAHCIVFNACQNLIVQRCNLAFMSGDAIQLERPPNQDIQILNNRMWTGELVEGSFNIPNCQWNPGEIPGENGVDTKVAETGWDQVERVRILIANCLVYGFIGRKDKNPCGLNLKEKIDAIVQNCVIENNYWGIRIRGVEGSADVLIENCLFRGQDIERGIDIRFEDEPPKAIVHNSIFEGGARDYLRCDIQNHWDQPIGMARDITGNYFKGGWPRRILASNPEREHTNYVYTDVLPEGAPEIPDDPTGLPLPRDDNGEKDNDIDENGIDDNDEIFQDFADQIVIKSKRRLKTVQLEFYDD